MRHESFDPHLRSKILEKASEELEAEVADIMRQAVITACGPMPASGNRKAWLAYGARRLGMNARRVKSIYYGETKHITAVEFIAALSLKQK